MIDVVYILRSAALALVSLAGDAVMASEPETSVPIAEAQEEDAIAPDRLVGAELRNLEDEHLGTLSDIVTAPETGEPALAIVTRTGFLGLGEQEVAVPWQLLRVVPGREDVIVLDTTDEVLEAAPEPDADLLVIPEMFEEHRRVVEEYWAAQEP